MFHEQGNTVVRKRLSFPSVAVLSISAVIITTLVCTSGIAVYGLRLVDKKADGLLGLAARTLENLPEYSKALPPALAEAINDERRPGYLDELEISVGLGEGAFRRHGSRIVVEVKNAGDQVVSLLSMRLVGLDAEGEPVGERNTWAATPIQLDGEWRGPLLPGETRRFPVWCWDFDEASRVTHEVTEVRVWRGPSPPSVPEAVASKPAEAV